MANTNNQDELAAYRQKLAASTQARLEASKNPNESIKQHQPQQEDRQWRNLSDPKEYEKWSSERRDKSEDWKRYKDDKLSGALSGGSGADPENHRREYWKAKDALRGVQSES